MSQFIDTGDIGMKLADVRTPLLPHQQRVVDRIQKEDQPGLVVIHGLGSGKTLTSIAAQDALNMPSQVVAPASLLGNYRKEREKHLTGKTPKANLTSMQNMAVKGESPSAPFMVVDEAHRARDPSSATYQTLKGNTAQKRMLLSGSPFYNHPSDIAPLIDLAADAKVLPYDKDEFTRRYISEKTVNPSIGNRLANYFRSDENKVRPGTVPVLYDKMAPELREAFHKWVDYHPGSKENFPDVTREDVRVPMSKSQMHVYDTLMDKAPAWVSAKVKRGLPPNKREAQQLNAFLTAGRQASNTTSPFVEDQTKGFDEPKIDEAFRRLQGTLGEDPTSRAVVYSNYLGAGINPYKKRLDEAGISYGEFTGQMPSKKRDQLVKDYNAGKLRALLLSSAGGEGLDLKGTRLMQILEPHWNNEKLKQVEGRGARYMSHADLPEEKRNLKIENYLSTRPQGMVSGLGNKLIGRAPDKSVDEYLTQMSQDKENLINQFRALLPNSEADAAQAEGKKKKAAAQAPTDPRSKELASSWKPIVSSHLSYTLPTAITGASMMNNITGDPVATAAGAALGAALGGLIAHAQIGALLPGGKRLAREALKSPQKENALREGAGKMDWGSIGSSMTNRMLPMLSSLPGLMKATPAARGLTAAAVGGQVLGAIGTGYLDKYQRMIASNELDNQKAWGPIRESEKLQRLRRQVIQLEDKVEGDGWKAKKEETPATTKSAPKDKSGKDW